MKNDDGGPAFPQNDAAVNRINNHDGMSLRDWFAGMVLQGLAERLSLTGDGLWYRDLADEAFKLADAMLAARKDEP